MTSSTDQEIETLLPFYVNGSLSDAERLAVEAALAARPDLQSEVAALKAVRMSMQAEDIRSPGEFGLARLMRDVKQEATMSSKRQMRVWQVAAAIALALFLGQTALMIRSEGPGVELAGEGQADLTLAFTPSATESEIRELLLDFNLEIVSGPSALGLYQIEILGDDDPEAVIQALEAATGIVESVGR